MYLMQTRVSISYWTKTPQMLHRQKDD